MNHTTSEVLDLAADTIQRNGWTRFTGLDCGGGPVCLEGALMAALDAAYLNTLWTSPVYQAMGEYLGHDVALTREVCGVIFPQQPLYRWNDFVAKSAEDVIAVLRAAAAVERVKESAEQTVAA